MLKWSEVAQSCPTLSNPMDCSPPGFSVHGIFQARVLEWGAIAFSNEGFFLKKPGKGQFSFQSQRKAMKRMLKLLHNCTHLTCWEGLGAGGEGDNRGWDGWMASPTWWTWVQVNSGSWWWTGRPGVLRFLGSQRATELNWTERNLFAFLSFSPPYLSPVELSI